MPLPTKTNSPLQSDKTFPRCTTADLPDGSMRVSFLVDVTEAKRLRSRASTMPMHRYMWENILQKAIMNEVY